MSQIIQKLDQQQLKSLCGIVAHTSEGLTKSELTTLLGQCRICSVDDGSSRNQLGYTIGLNKRDWLYNCLVCTSYTEQIGSANCRAVRSGVKNTQMQRSPL